MWAIDKSDLVNGVASPHFAHFSSLTANTVAPQPALSQGNPNAEYMLGSLDPNGTGDHRISVWAVTNRNQVGLGGTPTLTSITVNSEKYAIPPYAPQKGATSKLNPDDDRMQQTQFVGGKVWGELTTAVRPAATARYAQAAPGSRSSRRSARPGSPARRSSARATSPSRASTRSTRRSSRTRRATPRSCSR